MPVATSILFLPGAGGSAEFWRPVAERLSGPGSFRLLSWPGLGDELANPKVLGLDDLVQLVLPELVDPCDVVAQSMGGLVAMNVALAAPEKVRRLVLTATSAGVPVADLGASDWRPDYCRRFPNAAGWITEIQEDLTARLPSVASPVLLIWGDSDPISPVRVGERLAALLPNARLEVIEGGDHDVAMTHADRVASLIAEHLS